MKTGNEKKKTSVNRKHDLLKTPLFFESEKTTNQELEFSKDTEKNFNVCIAEYRFLLV